MKSAISRVLLWWCSALLLVVSVSCDEPSELEIPTVQMSFRVSLQPETRAPESLNPSNYTAKIYLFKEETAGSNLFVYWGEQAITSSTPTVSGLVPGTKYRFVFLAVPKGQQPTLPNFSTTRPGYTAALASYLSGAAQTANEVFRHILTFTASSSSNNSYTVVLTRQNGALQIRLNNSDGKIKTVKLEVSSLTQLYLNDGNGGQVLTTGTSLTLSKSAQASRTSDYRICINLLPSEDLTGKGRLTLTRTNGTQTVYMLQSTSGRIPVYPNQITWLVLGKACTTYDTATAPSAVQFGAANWEMP